MEDITNQTTEKVNYDSFIKKLVGSGYSIVDNNLCYEGQKGPVAISNFLPIIDEQIIYSNGKDVTTEYLVHGYLLDTKEELPQIRLTKKELESFNFVLNSDWKINAIICAGGGNKDKAREVAQIVSKDTMKITKVYACTGFIKENGKSIFLYHNGVIGDGKNIKVDLSGDKLQQYCFTDKEFDIKESLLTSFSVTKLADKKIMLPLIATTYLSPVTTLLREKGINADYILWIEGKTGTRKSSLAALALSHFGSFERNSFPCSFRDTLNSIEKKAFITKDTLNVVDDFNPESNSSIKQSIAEKLFAMYGDRAGRDRMSQDGKTLRSPYVARGQCIVTAESFPNVAESRLARCLIVSIKENDVNLKNLSYLQEHKEELAFTMKEYIKYIIDNEEKILQNAEQLKKKLNVENQNNQVHGRVNESVNVMYIGMSLYLNFLVEKEVITKDIADKTLAETLEVLNSLAKEQMQDVETSNPINMLFTALSQLYVTNRIHFRDFNSPTQARYFGTHIGYIDKKKNGANDQGSYLFFPDILYSEIVKFYRSQNINFPISKASLWKYLDTEGYLYKPEKADRRTVRRMIPESGNVVPFIQIPMEKIETMTFTIPKISKGFGY